MADSSPEGLMEESNDEKLGETDRRDHDSEEELFQGLEWHHTDTATALRDVEVEDGQPLRHGQSDRV